MSMCTAHGQSACAAPCMLSWAGRLHRQSAVWRTTTMASHQRAGVTGQPTLAGVCLTSGRGPAHNNTYAWADGICTPSNMPSDMARQMINHTDDAAWVSRCMSAGVTNSRPRVPCSGTSHRHVPAAARAWPCRCRWLHCANPGPGLQCLGVRTTGQVPSETP
jgi:hypothetical protein